MVQRSLRVRIGKSSPALLACLVIGSISACSGSARVMGDGGSMESELDGDDQIPGDSDSDTPAESSDAATGLDATPEQASAEVDALQLQPASTSLHLSGATVQTVAFSALGSRQGGAPFAVAASYALDTSDLGSIDATTGLFTSNNRAGGTVTVTARYQGYTATAQLIISLDAYELSGSGLPADPAALFDPAHNQVVKGDPTHTPALLYPVAETMFPQNLAHVLFQWRAGGAKLFQLAFHSSVLDYKVYTDGVQETCTQAGTGATCWQSDDSAWQKLAQSNAGRSVTLTVRSTDPAHPGTIYEAAPVTLYFSTKPVPGAIYYWSTTAKGVRRGRLSDLGPANFFTPDEANGNCVACHTLSRNGQALAADVGGEKLWVVNVTKEVPPPPRFTSYQTKDIASSWATFNPDTTRIVSSKNGILTLRDGATGAPIGPNAGAIALNKNLATMPDWAPNGSHLVFAMGPNAKGRKATAASIAQLTVSGDQFGTLETIVASTGSSDANSWPMFDPSSQWIAFVKSAASSEKDATAQVNVVKAQAGAQPQALTRANTLVNDQAIATGLYNNMPTWAPTREGDLAWVAFTSTRDYGTVLASGSKLGSQKRQLWIAAVDSSKLGSADPSYPAFRVPFQELTENAHRPFWAEDALVKEDAGVPDAGIRADAGNAADAGADAGVTDAGTSDAGRVCVPMDGDCAKGDCCSGLSCEPVGDSYQCQVPLL
jgi:hypothetical protein